MNKYCQQNLPSLCLVYAKIGGSFFIDASMPRKLHKTVDEQLTHLEEKGLEIQDRDSAKSFLYVTNYYRLSGYWYIYKKKGAEVFTEGTSFEQNASLKIRLKPQVRKNQTFLHENLNLTKDGKGNFDNRIYNSLVMLAHTQDKLHADTSWVTRLKELLHTYPKIDFSQMGFPENWVELSLWKD